MVRDQVPISKQPNPVAVICRRSCRICAAATTRSPPTCLATSDSPSRSPNQPQQSESGIGETPASHAPRSAYATAHRAQTPARTTLSAYLVYSYR
jgi:hypothetical protein